MKRYTKAEQIKDLILALNELRVKQGKVKLIRCWTGAAHWLRTVGDNYKSVGAMYSNDDRFIGFLEGLLEQE